MNGIDPNFTIYVNDGYYQHKDKIQNRNSYQYFAKKFNMDNITLFTITVLIGKYIVKNKEELKKQATFLKWGSAEKFEEFLILKAIAIEENNNDVSILKNQEAMAKIWQEYAMAGMKEFCIWNKDNSIDLQSKLEDIMLEFHERNMLIFKNNNDMND